MSTSPRSDRGESTPDAFRHRRVPLSLSVGGAWSLWQGDERGAVRVPIRFGVTIPRWRVHVRNYTTRTGRPGSSPVVVPGIWIGRRTGSRVDETVRISPELTSRGDDMVTPWQETPLGAHRDYMLVIRYFSDGPSLQQVGGCWTVPFEDAVSAADGRHSSRMPLDVWIEAEVPQEVPVLAAFGDSLSSGITATLPVHDSWLSQWCRVHGVLPVHYVGSGYTMNIWPEDDHSAWTRWRDLSRPDVCVFSMGSNDVHGRGANIVALRAKHQEAMRQVRRHVSAVIRPMTILPRNESSDQSEDLRRTYNRWLAASYPADLIDVVPPIAPDNRTLLPELQVDGIHLNSAGYLALARSVPRDVVEVALSGRR